MKKWIIISPYELQKYGRFVNVLKIFYRGYSFPLYLLVLTFFVRLHFSNHLIFLFLEDCEHHAVQMVPTFIVVHAQVRAHSLDHNEQVSYSPVDVRSVGVGIGAKHVWTVIEKVPNMAVWAEHLRKLAPLILNLTLFDRIKLLLLLLFSFLTGEHFLHLCPPSALGEILLDSCCDSLCLQPLAILGETLEQDEVLNIFEYLPIDASECGCTCQPRIPTVLVIVVVILPDPGPLNKQTNEAHS